MSRKPRFILPGVPQHVVQRGHNRARCFFEPADYQRYLHDLHDAALKNRVQIHAYVLMTNHVHLLLTPETPFGLSSTMQDTGRRFVRYVNSVYRRTGSLWEGRYKASLVDSEAYLLTCMRYIEMNPVRAGMERHPGDYRWSSYAANALGKRDRILRRHPLYLSLGETPGEREHAYRELFARDLCPGQIHEVRDALNQELVLGREAFKDRVEKTLNRQTRPGAAGRPRVGEESAYYAVSSYIRENCVLTPVSR